ncbi:hypothetical protein MMC28_008597 [Mycoblastus sanguinarius]|nr:hypothetical protein [Mycoblastus sanguinarius]
MSFLDRINIGNAITLGLPKELHLKGNQTNAALAIFYVPYIIVEIPSNILLKRFKPHIWLSGCMITFGLVMMCQGFVQNYSGLLAARFFLGFAEAGVFPGCFYLMSMWYTREEVLRRFSFFFNSSTLAGAFGGLLASAIEKMQGLRGYSGWRWIFILEGLLTIVLAFLSYFMIVDFPEDATWLTEDEREFMQARLMNDSNEKREPSSMKAGLCAHFKDYKSYLVALLFFGENIVAYSLTYFLPTIVQDFKYSEISTQLHSVPPFAAAYVFSLIISFASAKAQHRLPFILFPLLVALAGAGILLNVHNNVRVEYAAVCLVAMGVFGAMPTALCWYIMNLGGHFERAVGSAWMVGFGNIGGIVATFSFLAADAPFYHKGVCWGLFGGE